MDRIEILGFVAAGFELLGIWLVGNKVRISFLVFVLSGLCWISYVFITGKALGLMFVCSIALVLNIRGYIKWGKHEKDRGKRKVSGTRLRPGLRQS